MRSPTETLDQLEKAAGVHFRPTTIIKACSVLATYTDEIRRDERRKVKDEEAGKCEKFVRDVIERLRGDATTTFDRKTIADAIAFVKSSEEIPF